MTDALTPGETTGAFRAACSFRLGGTAELTVAGADEIGSLCLSGHLDLLDPHSGSTIR